MNEQEKQELIKKVNEVNSLQLKAILREHPEREKEIIAQTLRQLADHEIVDHGCSTSANILQTLADYLSPLKEETKPVSHTSPTKTKTFIN